MAEVVLQPYIDPIIVKELENVKHRVLKKDHDWVACVDGEEGSGKSVLAMQICKYLDPNFSLDRIVFNSDDFIKIIKDPKTPKGAAILLDEAFSAANARASMSEVNRSMVAVATEMRQRNLFVIIALPSFFDLDRTFAIHRTKALFHVYLDEDFNRGQYVIFPKNLKRDLYIAGKKKYSYAFPYSPYPPCRFYNQYIVNEDEYRLKKSEAFKKRVVSNQARKWMMQRNAYIKYLYHSMGLTQDELAKIPTQYGVDPVGQQQISTIMKEIMGNEGGV